MRSASPGAKGSRLTYGLHEQVMPTDGVLEKVKDAREQVEKDCVFDVLGINQPEFSTSTAVKFSKYTREFTDRLMSTYLTPDSIDSQDFRKTKSVPAPKVKAAAFDRGDVTTGWNHSSALNQKELKEQALKATEMSLKNSQNVIKAVAKNYLGPVQRHDLMVEKIRKQKETEQAEFNYWAATYGPDGGAAIQQKIAATHGSTKPRRPKPTSEDIASVLSLPDPEAESPSELDEMEEQ